MKKQTVLIVDDAPKHIELLNLILGSSYDIKVALNGEKRLKSQRTLQTCLILLDVMMSGMDWSEVCRQLKAGSRTDKIPIIFVSALSEAQDESKGFEAGAVDYISKSVNVPLVCVLVKIHLALYDQNRLLEERVRKPT